MKKSIFKSLPKAAAVFSIAAVVAGTAQAQITPFSDDFEGLATAGTGTGTELSDIGWQVGASVFDGVGTFPGNSLFFFGLFGAPNDGGDSFSAVATGDATNGGVGVNYLNVYSAYSCCDPDPAVPGSLPTGHKDPAQVGIVNALVLKEYTITAADIGSQVVFTFDVKRPDFIDDFAGGDDSAAVGNNCSLNCTASAFVKTLDPGAGFSTTNELLVDTTAASQSGWVTETITLDITDPLLNGQILQVGFQSFAGNFDNSGVYYDNVSMVVNDISAPVAVPVPAIALAILAGLLGGVVAVRRTAIK